MLYFIKVFDVDEDIVDVYDEVDIRGNGICFIVGED